jgi:hypothetical protein
MKGAAMVTRNRQTAYDPLNMRMQRGPVHSPVMSRRGGRKAIQCVPLALVVTALTVTGLSAQAEQGISPNVRLIGAQSFQVPPGLILTSSGVMPDPSFTPLVPSGRGAWVIQVVTTGGYGGGVRRTLLASDGKVTCLSECPASVGRGALNQLRDSVRTAVTVEWSGIADAPTLVCNDCLTSYLSLWHRDEDGNVNLFTTQWGSLRAEPDPSVRRLYDHVLAAVKR